VITILTTAYAALLSQMALAVFNDGVRPFLLDFSRGESSRAQMTTIAINLSVSFIFGLGLPVALASGVLNPWLLFLPTDILGMLSPKRWLAPILGALWGTIVVFGLGAATTIADNLPVKFLTGMQQVTTPILLLFAFFPAVAITMQFGRRYGAVGFIASLLAMLAAMKWLPQLFPGTAALAIGMLLLITIAVMEEINSRKEVKKRAVMSDGETAGEANPGGKEATARAEDNEAASIFAANGARLRKHAPYFIAMGILLGMLANMHMFGGGEATSFIVARGYYDSAAQVDFYRAFGFIPLTVTTAIASGAFQIVGLTLIYPAAYLLPNPVVAGAVGGILSGIEILILRRIALGLSWFRVARDTSDNIRNAMNLTLEIALLFGSIAAGNAMAGDIGIGLVGGLYALNEAFGRPVVRLAAGPGAVILGALLLNLLAYLHLFTPISSK
jgi:hypothetical protein